ncbi:simple sugar transport system substrate-binding protein/ribose transport system substrate-binding protein [Kaistia hirudinis]|uniref:Simple sugar transport system substrate-binding protein/ribose transport system substrate-binding protein n=1 Tax=Kaistia hirudinis TaxID=1293440 RepID=A0A840AKM4_9HYPH|nr:substrate-binding domain-containing protein [Kaistia hirudinis]MBB3929813.1 simple sugar transport system substrate-binding protein/ribose transport system substrate-binding protein [Kaistia hirudinis]
MTFLKHMAALAAGLSMIALAGAASAEEFKLSPEIAQHAKDGKKLVFAISYHDPSVAFAGPIRDGVAKAAADLGVEASFVGPVGGGAEKQIAELETIIEKGVDGLAISSASTDALAPLINKTLAKGIPVIAFNTDNPKSDRLTFIGQDLVLSGKTVGEQLVKYMGEKGKIVITSLDTAAQWSLDREKGARETLAKYPGIEIVNVVNTGTESQQIYGAIENTFAANPDLTGMISLECCSFPQIGLYLKRNPRSGEFAAVGFDLLPQTLQLIKEGHLDSTISQNPYAQGYKSVEVLTDIVKNGKMPPKMIDTGAEIVDKTNVDQYIGK